jgi:hypothetical protein
MNLFEEGGPLDPDEIPEPAAPEVAPSPGRSLGVFLLVFIDLALAGLAVGGAFFLAGARAYLLADSSDFGTEMSDALTGLKVLTLLCWVLAGGFAVSGLGVLSLTRIGYRLAALWALLVCVTVAGLAYGVPVLVFLRLRSTRERIFS